MTDRQKCVFPNCGKTPSAFRRHRPCGKLAAYCDTLDCHPFIPTPDTPTDRTREQELILDLFRQGCGGRADGKYSHDCISTYEEAQEYLIEKGLIKKSECVYE